MTVSSTFLKLVGLVPFIGRRISAIYELQDWRLQFCYSDAPHLLDRLKDEYTTFGSWILLLLFPNELETMEKVERHILRSKTSDEVMQLKASVSSDCNMVAVAGAIIAQVAITALSLNQLSETHWTTRGAFITSLVTGSISVFLACRLSSIMGRMYSPIDVKDWLSKPCTRSKRREFEKQMAGPLKKGSRISEEERKHLSDQIRTFMNENQLTVASLDACFMLQAPGTLLNLSVGSFLVGFGLYLGFVFGKNLDDVAGEISSRAVLISYIVCVVCCLGIFFGPRHMKTMDYEPLRRWIRIADTAKKSGVTAMVQDEESRGAEFEDSPNAAAPIVSGESAAGARPQPLDNPNMTALEVQVSALRAVINAQEESIRATRLALGACEAMRSSGAHG